MLSTKIRQKLLTAILSILFSSNAFAQIRHDGSPFPLHASEKARSESISQHFFVDMPSFDIEEAITRSESEQAGCFKSFEFARKFHVFLRPDNSGTTFVRDNMNVWRVGIRSKKALSLNLLFSKFRLPQGAKVFVYNTDQSEILGAYTEENNTDLNLLPVQPLAGDELIVEYQEPIDAESKGEIEIGEVNHDFRGILRAAEPRDPVQSCHPNIVCYPEDTQAGRGTVALIINGTTYCTGVLVNNSSSDGTPYLLTATHCLNKDYNVQFLANRRYNMVAGSIVAFFGYQAPVCGAKDIRGQIQMTMASADSVLINEKHDISLLRFKQTPPAEYRPYYPGWNISSAPAPPFHGIHHPNGGIKKVAIENDAISIISFGKEPPYNMTENAHWNISSWDVAATEAGSSGSPLFDKDKRVVGTLSGGTSYCSQKTPDQYASLYKAWNITGSLGNTNSLKNYLDPANTQLQQIDGYDPYKNEVYTKSSNYVTTDSVVQSYNQSIPMFSTNNTYGYTEFAEEFTSETAVKLQGIFVTSALTDKMRNLNVRIKIYADDNGMPGTLIYDTPLNYSNRDMATRNVENYVRFATPQEVSGKFYIAYSDANNTPNGFAALNVMPRAIGGNKKATAWMRNSAGWVRSSENLENPLNTSLTIALYVIGNGLVNPSQTPEETDVKVSYDQSTGRIIIEANKDLVAWKVFYSNGQKVSEGKAKSSINRTSVPADYLAKGVYIVTVDTVEGKVVRKVLAR